MARARGHLSATHRDCVGSGLDQVRTVRIGEQSRCMPRRWRQIHGAVVRLDGARLPIRADDRKNLECGVDALSWSVHPGTTVARPTADAVETSTAENGE